MCLGGLKEGSQKIVQLQETGYDAFCTAMEYLYTGNIDFEKISETIMDVRKLFYAILTS
jgi:hypothetical protein